MPPRPTRCTPTDAERASTRRARRGAALAVALALLATLPGVLAGCRRSTPAPPPAPAPAAPAGTPAEPDLASFGGRPVLLVTHISADLLRDLAKLRESGLLGSSDLAVVALRHERERGGFSAVRRLARKRKLDWFALHTVRCPLTADDVFRRNACTPELERLVALASGVLVPGGADLPPGLYGEETDSITRLATPNRHPFEATLLWHLVGRAPDDHPLLADRPSLPVLAICLGMQTLNVAAGGDLTQDVRAELYDIHTVEAARAQPATLHRNPAWELHPAPSVESGVWHPILPRGRPTLWGHLVPDGQPIDVVSAHHQAVDHLGADLEILATSADGRVVEALGHTRFPHVLGVQFHPERRALYDPDLVARARPGSKVRNVLARKMGEDPRVLRLHQELWRTFAGWMAEEAARR